MSQHVRNQAIDPTASFLVQAPAGSGKTELLTQRILALLTIVDEPEEILALTFTRKASAEMRNRVIQSLNMPKPSDPTSHNIHTWELACAVLSRSQEKQWFLLENPNRLRIMTLDSLTGSLARQLPLLSGLGEMATPSEYTRATYRKVVEIVLTKGIKHHQQAIEHLLLHHDHNTIAVIDLIADMLENREQWLPYMVIYGRDHDELRQTLEHNMSEYIRHQLQACDALIPIETKSNIPALMRFSGAHLGSALLENFQLWPNPDLEHLEDWHLLASFLLTKDPQFRKIVTKRNGFPADAKDEKAMMLNILGALADTHDLADTLHNIRLLPAHPHFDEQQWQLMQSLFTLLPLIVAELQQSFSSQGKTDFTEMSLRSLNALTDVHNHPSDLLLKLDYRIHHVLIDEFQDTSELQIQLLRCLTSGWQQDDGRTLFMVGDPMQSIYRFRKAEVGLFLKTAQNQTYLPPVEPLQLERNFRSSPAIVHWVNNAFKHLFPKIQDVISGAIPYAQAQAAQYHEGQVSVHFQVGDNAQAEAEQVVQLIQNAVAQDQRVGVLARTRKHLHAIILHLSEAGVAFRAIRILPLHSRPEVRLLRALTRALLHPGDRESWAALLRSPACGLTSHEMHTLIAGDDRNIWEIIHQNTNPRVEHLKNALTPAMLVRGKVAVRQLIETAWSSLSMPSILDPTAQTNIETVLQLIEQLDADHVRGHIDFKLFDECLEKLFAAPDTSKQAAQVELMTMHGAKGLQWDVVILPGLGKAPKSSDSPLLAFTEASFKGEPMLLMSPKAETRQKDALFSCIQNIEKNKQSHEFSRLLYVACTRAESKLHLLGHISKKGDAGKGSLLSLLLQHDESYFGADVHHFESNAADQNYQFQPLQRIQYLPDISPKIPNNKDSTIETIYGWAGVEAAPIGNAVHAALQDVAEYGVEKCSAEHTCLVIEKMRHALIAEGLSGEILLRSTQRSEKALSQALNSDRGRWVLSSQHQHARCEWALSSKINDQIMHVIIDRSFIDKNGTRWIIDYKTASHEGGNIEAFLDTEQLRHAPQLERYGRIIQSMEDDRPIKLALYFPMLDCWREWDFTQP